MDSRSIHPGRQIKEGKQQMCTDASEAITCARNAIVESHWTRRKKCIYKNRSVRQTFRFDSMQSTFPFTWLCSIFVFFSSLSLFRNKGGCLTTASLASLTKKCRPVFFSLYHFDIHFHFQIQNCACHTVQGRIRFSTRKKIQFRDLQIYMQFQLWLWASQMKSKLCQKPIFVFRHPFVCKRCFLSIDSPQSRAIFGGFYRQMILSCLDIATRQKKIPTSDFLIKKLYCAVRAARSVLTVRETYGRSKKWRNSIFLLYMRHE